MARKVDVRITSLHRRRCSATVAFAFALALLFALLATEPVQAQNITSQKGLTTAIFSLQEGVARHSTAWSQSGTFSNVTITAPFMAFPQTQHIGTAYLTTQIGPATTLGDQVAVSNFTFPAGNEPTTVLLFQGLTLGPGTYYLTVIGTENSGDFWGGTLVSVPYNSPGSFLLSSYVSDSSFPAYPPSSIFVQDNDEYLIFAVENVVVPEPSTFALAALGLLGLGCVALRKKFRRA